MDAITQLQVSQTRSHLFESDSETQAAPDQPPVKLLAFYLPQFHPIPENDAWWGKGFTEWTNVTKAIPRFPGHYQPRLPADLGYYDLRLVDTLRAQATLAKQYGVGGFCFHWYWFAGKRLLETPLRILMANQDIELPFFINWANENWTRRWDGQDKSVLIAQQYGPEDDIALADAFLELVKDHRYIRIGGRPLLMIYRPSLLPDAAATVARWRQRFAEKGERSPYVLMPQAFEDNDPNVYGIDAVVQYPPHNMGSGIERINDLFPVYDSTFSGNIFSYDALIQRMLDVPLIESKFFRGVCPGWDNEARRSNGGSLFVGATPRKFGRWLAEACQRTVETEPEDKRIVFVNAWNEWAEGAYLEPDRHFGHAFLQETARVMNTIGDRARVDAFVQERLADPDDIVASSTALKRFIVKASRKVARSIHAIRTEKDDA